jgi:hypothetical protein
MVESPHPLPHMAARYRFHCPACNTWAVRAAPKERVLRPGFTTLDEQAQADLEEARMYGFRSRRQMWAAWDSGNL